ncbi:adenylate/guanylate cyclase domain-containing protein [Micromonospora sp. CPCC 206060]|uniref:adenylate/guanylate cyclase domain-containing protein n=1 Tax=Micromonospora sp. CPCC 206060 TaxID=3122406 RepID=UPI002FF2F242
MRAPCAQCGRNPAPDDRFCGGCGTELASACPHCGYSLAADAAFCTSCGKPRTAGAPPAGTPQEDRRRVSVLFVDLIDFTPYVERADPELVRGMQTGFFSAARRVVGQYGGVVEKYIGDAVMALFGAPVATETDALRCVRAGLELQRVLTRFAPTGADQLRFRVGVATGEALVDVAAARDGGQAIVAGDVVNTASRMQSVAPPGGVLVCGNTYALTKNAIRYDEQPPVTLRGRSSPTEVWLAREPVQAQYPDRESDATPLIDREHELGLLVNALHRTIREQVPQVVTLFGRAGIGKSRLVRELYRHTERLVDDPLTWRTGRCPPFGENVTFAALADIVKAEAGILDTDPASVAVDRLAAAVGGLVGPAEADRLVDTMRPLIGLPGTPLPPEETESAWRRFLVALAARRPTVLVFEDLHWADEAMLRFVELLGASARDVPLLVLCTARPELVDRDPSWAGTMTGSLTITLPPLRNTGIASLYQHMFGATAFPSEMLAPLVEVADGNPLYAHEYVRMLIEQGALRQSGRGWSLEKQSDLPMPDSVHAVIANRVDLLDASDRTVLLAASVVGMQFWPGAVAAALGRPVESVERALRRLEQRDFVHEQRSSVMAGQPEYRFRHILVRDVCYQRLPRTERVARHERTADWLDALSRGRDTDLAEVLAHHRWAAHEIARTLGVDTDQYAPAAREALHRAARRAYALHALDAAASHAGRALSLADDVDDPLGRLQLELLSTEISFHRDGPAFLSGGGTGQLTALADRLLAHGDQACAARAWTLLGQAAWLRADRDTALACLDRAVKLFDGLPDTQPKADAYAELGRLHMLNYERDPAIAAAGTAGAIAQRLGLVETQTNARITVAAARYQAGDRGGLDELHAATEFCRIHQLFALPRAVQNLAYALREEGDWIRSRELLGTVEGGTALTTGYSNEAMRAYFDGDFGRLLTAADAFVDTPSGRWDMQVRGLRACLRVLRDEPVPGVAGEPGDGRDDVTEALETARRSGFHRVHWTMVGLAAFCRALQGRYAEADELLDELATSWSGVPALASGEWVSAAAYAAALTGRDAAVRVRGMLDRVGHRTIWADAAMQTVTAALAGADGDHDRAAQLHAAAAKLYAHIPDTTDQLLALALAAGELARAGAVTAAAQAVAEVRAFADRNRAPGLLLLARAAG